MYFEKLKLITNQKLSSYSINELIVAAMIFGIPLTIKLGNIVLIFAFLFALYHLVVNFKFIQFSITNFYLIFPCIFFAIVLGSALLSHDLYSGFVQLEKNLLVLLIPLTLHILCYKRKIDYNFLFKIYALSNFVVTFLLLVIGILRILKGASTEVFFFHEFTAFLDLHPVYVAINISLTLFYISQYYLVHTIITKKKLLVTLALLIYFYFVLYLCASKGVILFFTFLYVIQLWLIFKKTSFKLIALSIALMFTIGLLCIPKVSTRFMEGLHFNIANFQPTDKIEKAKVFSNIEKDEISDLELRYLMLKIGCYHIYKENKFIWGYGIGDVQNYTDYHYMIYGLAPGWFEGYNLHNQYLQYLVSYGLFGMVFFLVYLTYSFIIALRTKSRIYLLFIVLIMCIFLFESLLARNKGIVIFYFFNTLFLIKVINENRYFRNQRNSQ